jgi:hypothetical protein
MDYPHVVGVITAQATDISELCNAMARAEQMPAQVLVAGGIAESDLNEHAERYGVWPDVSFGLWQQTVAYAPIGDQSQSPSNVAYVREQLFNVHVACTIAAPQFGQYWRQYGQFKPTLDDGLRETLGRYNYPAVGYDGNPNASNIAQAVQRSWAYVSTAPTPPPPPATGLIYDAFVSPERQVYDWTCSLNTSYWMLRSVGVAVPDKETYGRWMIDAGLISEAQGLLDGSGTALAQWLSATFHVDCQAVGVASWDWHHALHTGYGPVGMGSGAMYHWLVAKWMASTTVMELMNPAPGYRGVWEMLTDAAYADWGPWYVIWIPATPITAAGGGEPELSQAEVDELAYLRSWSGLVRGDYMDKQQAELAKARGAPDLASAQPALEQIQGVINTIRAG